MFKKFSPPLGKIYGKPLTQGVTITRGIPHWTLPHAHPLWKIQPIYWTEGGVNFKQHCPTCWSIWKSHSLCGLLIVNPPQGCMYFKWSSPSSSRHTVRMLRAVLKDVPSWNVSDWHGVPLWKTCIFETFHIGTVKTLSYQSRVLNGRSWSINSVQRDHKYDQAAFVCLFIFQ